MWCLYYSFEIVFEENDIWHFNETVFSRNKKTHEEKPTPPISAPIGPPTIGTGTQLGAHHTGHHTLTKDKGKDDKKGFARLASFSRKKKSHNENKSSTEDIGTRFRKLWCSEKFFWDLTLQSSRFFRNLRNSRSNQITYLTTPAPEIANGAETTPGNPKSGPAFSATLSDTRLGH